MVCSQLNYQIALTLLSGFGIASLRPLLERYNPAEIFNTPTRELLETPNVRPSCIQAIADFKDWDRVKKEIRFIEEKNIKTFFITDPTYPFRLRECADAPLLLYARGELNLNPEKILAIVGTRNNSQVGKRFTEELLSAFQQHRDLVIISGLAAGIDTIAHQEALRNQLPTLAVLAHGLDRIYPPINRRLAKDIIDQGGSLLSECRHGEAPDRFLFPRRNRIVAGLADATLVIESAVKGGSLITANLAFNYGRSVFALPGRIYDEKSGGCLELLKTQKAQLITSATDLLYWMNWNSEMPSLPASSKKSYTHLTEEERNVIAHLKDGEIKHIDSILASTGMPPAQLATILLNLSLADHLVSLPGNKYQLI